jgi:hypothetical protein
MIPLLALRSRYNTRYFDPRAGLAIHTTGTNMATITVEIPDELVEQVARLRDRLPELLALSLWQPALPAATYRYILDFLAGNPSPEQIAAFGPPPQVQARLRTLLERSAEGHLSPAEVAELDEYERIEHVMVMIKAGSLPCIEQETQAICPPRKRLQISRSA